VSSPARDPVSQLLDAVSGRGYDDPVICCDVGWLSHHRAGASAGHHFHTIAAAVVAIVEFVFN
jgi:ribosomal protein S12 methylthiotransferase accessory factor YcaO